MASVQAPKRMGRNYHPYEAAYISQINTVQRHVARDLGIPLIDYEVIMGQVRPSLWPPEPPSAGLPYQRPMSLVLSLPVGPDNTLRMVRVMRAPRR